MHGAFMKTGRHEDMKTMQLVPRSIDRALGHSGGDFMTTGQDA
ncbi:A nuclease of the HNH/ENDO VII superfamily with conserved WHH [Bradyrhizobium shewense]|uniref:A nuclease of the HNH/ENDO VII superfamily with conserved WHH n=1 Tax=Bradyrhizobium shewense TaxID=1761772 RepID=A0A1C3W529_9BRAD|nr:A nuclease of the HNH/ENDO VII superfamily with conserved WHH [Bradyrhizobium shewense]